jgi:hypothetical protein
MNMLRVPSKFKDKYYLDSNDMAWLAPELIQRLGDTEPTVKAVAKRMNLWPSQVIKIAREYPKTFEVIERTAADHIRIVPLKK